MLNRLPIGVKVFIAPAIIIVLMLGVMLVSNLALRRQHAAFLRVVGGSLTTSTTTTRLLLAVAELQSEVLRYAQLQQRLPADDRILVDLRRSIMSRYEAADTLFGKVKSTSSSSESDAITNIADFLTIHRAVSMRILDSTTTGTMAVSTLMAHYQQLQSYIVELATRSLESAQVTETETAEYVKHFLRYLLFGSIATIAVSIALTLYVGRVISMPITNMITVMSAIAAGNFTIAVPGMQRRDEIGAMARAVDVFASVSKELRSREESLIEARALAEVASQHKSQFLASMSHELRTPLNAILGYTELILDEIYGAVPEQIREVLERVQQSGRHLLDLINDVLDISKMEAGQLTLSLSDYSMAEVVQTVFTAVESLATEKDLALQVTLPADLPLGRGDERRLAQVLLNLVGNAIKFTDTGEVQIRVAVADSAFVVAVSDTGPGIAEADQQKIFEEFQQADSSSTRPKGGTGLGLAIVKRMVGMHGGRVWVESHLGEGSTFWFTLPVRVEQQKEAA